MKSVISIFLCFIVFHTQVFAINLPQKKQFSISKPSEFVFRSYESEELISVKLLGAVKKAGLYHIPAKMDLVTLLSLSGGTTKDADIEEIIIGRKGKGSEPIKVNLEKTIRNLGVAQYQLGQDDVILVKRKAPFISGDTWRSVSIISVILTSVLTVLAIEDRSN